ncbi:MAG: helix-turn-helix domain-containing protein [Ferruginibacter sp.]
MLLKDYIPAPDVEEFVQLYRIIHFCFKKGEALPFKAYPPRPEHCLAFYPHDTEVVEYKNSGRLLKHIPVVLYGQFSEVTNRLVGQHFMVLQIIFHPGALFRLTGIPASEFNNTYMDAENIFSTELRSVNEQLYHAKDYESILAIANNFMRRLAAKSKKDRSLMDEACILLLKNKLPAGVRSIAKEACMSVKQLERKFKERVGVNPKLYERIMRFDNAFRLKNSQPGFDWLRVAVECGYHDYQHLAKEYKDFTGLYPAAFHEIENKAPERMFGLVEGYY